MNDSYRSHGITRRQFLKASAATAAVLAVSDKLWAGKSGSLVQAASVAGQDEWLHSYCRNCQQPVCSTLVHVKDGVVMGIEGDPASPVNQGTLCPRGQSAIFNLYNPYRVKAPLKRTNPEKSLENDPKWVEITWDEALNTTADKLKKLAAVDPRKILFVTGFGVARDYQLWSPLIQSIGAQTVGTSGPLCSTHIAVRLTQADTTCAPDYNFADYVITLGSSVGANWGTAGGPVRGLMNALDRGMKLVVVDPRAGKEASLGEWVPIRPASELAFELAFMNVMLYEIGLSKLDVPFLKNRSNAPYLVTAAERYMRDTATKKPMVWDPTDNKAKVFDDPTIKDYALEGEFQLNGEKVQPGFALVKAGMKTYTPEWAEPLTTIPAATIRRLANEFVAAAKVGSTIMLDGMEFPLRPAMIWPKRGALSQQDAAYVHFTSKMIQELIGGMDVPGGDETSEFGPLLKPDADGVVTSAGTSALNPWTWPPSDVELTSFFPMKHSVPYIAWRTIIDPKKYYLPFQVDAIITYGGNPLVSNAAPDEPLAAYKKVSFTASISYHFDEPTMLADIVLPESSNYEREMFYPIAADSKGRWALQMPIGTVYRYPVVPLVHNTKQSDEIFYELARRMGLMGTKGGMNALINNTFRLKPEYALDTEKPYTIAEIMDRRFKSTLGPDKGTDYMKKVGIDYQMGGPKTIYNYAYFPMGKTRYHFFMERVRAIGDQLKDGLAKNGIPTIPGWDMAEVMEHYHAVPVWRPMPIHKQAAEYDMYFTNWKTPFVLFGLGGTAENPWLYEIAKETDPYQRVISMHPDTALKKGLKEGDMIEVTSRSGKVTGRLKLSYLFHPEVIGTPGNFGRRSLMMNPIAREGINYNQLVVPDDGWFDPLNTALVASPRVKVRKV